MEIKNKIKEHLKDVATLKKSTHSIAFGFALGTFIAISPTFGFGIFIGLFLVLIFKKISKFALFTSFFIWNPFILFLLYPVSFGIGKVILSNGSAPAVQQYKFEILNQLFAYSRIFLIGSLILAVIISMVSYFFMFSLITFIKRKREKNLQMRNN